MRKLDISPLEEQYIAVGFKLGWDCAQISWQEALQSLELWHGKEFTFTDKSNTPVELASSTEFNKEIAELHGEINEYYELPAGWDNESDEVTNPQCLDLAKRFVDLLDSNCFVPRFSAGTGEEVALYWDSEEFYLIVHFFESGKMKFFYENQVTKNKTSGWINELNKVLPRELSLYISR